MVSGCTTQNHQRMKDKLLSLKGIRKNWWWRRKEILRDVVRTVDWPAVEEAARNYELMRRSKNGKQFTQTYLELCREEKTILHTLWVNRSRVVFRVANHRQQYNEKGWTPVYETEHRQWNLRLADKKLIDEFIREIRTLREIQKISAPSRNKGEKHRGVSWKLIEVLDCKQNGVGKLNHSHRHTLSEAQRRAEKYFAEYERALDQWRNSSNPAFTIEEPDDSDTTEQSE